MQFSAICIHCQTVVLDRVPVISEPQMVELQSHLRQCLSDYDRRMASPVVVQLDKLGDLAVLLTHYRITTQHR